MSQPWQHHGETPSTQGGEPCCDRDWLVFRARCGGAWLLALALYIGMLVLGVVAPHVVLGGIIGLGFKSLVVNPLVAWQQREAERAQGRRAARLQVAPQEEVLRSISNRIEEMAICADGHPAAGLPAAGAAAPGGPCPQV